MQVSVNEIIRKLSPAERKKVEDHAAEIIAEEMSLRDLRKARKLTQARVAKAYNLLPEEGGPMAKTKQFTISVQNQPGTVLEIVKTLGNAKVNILSLLGTAQGTSGTVYLIVEDPRRAKKVMDDAKLTYQETEAEQYELPNKPGALAQSLKKLAAKGVNLNSIHATAVKGAKKAVVVYTAEATAKAAAATA